MCVFSSPCPSLSPILQTSKWSVNWKSSSPTAFAQETRLLCQETEAGVMVLDVLDGGESLLYSRGGRLFCGARTRGCSSPLCPAGGGLPAGCPYLQGANRRDGLVLQVGAGSTADRLTSRDHGALQMDKRPDIMRVVLKGSGSDPVLVLLVHVGGDELELDHCALRRARHQAAPVLMSVKGRQTGRTGVSPTPRSDSPATQTEPGRPTC